MPKLSFDRPVLSSTRSDAGGVGTGAFALIDSLHGFQA
jgi:hypothetical protein